MSTDTREMTQPERALVRWMLEHGKPEAKSFLPQLEGALVTTWKCECGCASFNLCIPGLGEAPPGVNILAEFLIEIRDDGYSEIFVFESGGILRGIEVCGVPEAPKKLPTPDQLRPYGGNAEKSPGHIR
jgi:hypothetical protein